MVSSECVVRTWPTAVLRSGALLPACPFKGRISWGCSDRKLRFFSAVAEPIPVFRRVSKLVIGAGPRPGRWPRGTKQLNQPVAATRVRGLELAVSRIGPICPKGLVFSPSST